MTAVVGRNGSGKSRFLRSIGQQTEVVLSMPNRTPDPRTDSPSRNGRVAGLWGTAPSRSELDQHKWVPSDPNGGFEGRQGVSTTWLDQPRHRFEHFVQLFEGGVSQSEYTEIQEQTNEKGATMAAAAVLDRSWPSEKFREWALQRIGEASQLSRQIAGYAATAMHCLFYKVRADPTIDLLLACLGVELANQAVIGVTGASSNNQQRLRFWFEANWSTTPFCSAVLAAHAWEDETDPARRQDLLDSASTRDRALVEAVAELVPVCFAWADSGLETHVGSMRHFTPLLPLDLDGSSGVLHEGTPGQMWLESLRAPTLGDATLRSAAGCLNPLGSPWGAVSWEVGWRQRFVEDTNSTFERIAEHDFAVDGPFVLSVPSVQLREEAEDAWRSSLLHGDSRVESVRFEFSSEILEFCARAVRAVNHVASVILADPPTALIDPSSGALQWRYIKHGPLPTSPSDLLAFDELSFAEQRWMRFATLIASRLFDRVLRTYGDDSDRSWVADNLDTGEEYPVIHPGLFPGTDLLVTIDEPESGLHPTAVDRLARGLNELATHLGIHFVVATHSPIVLRVVQASHGSIAHAHLNSDGERVFETVDSAELDRFAHDLGMNPVDLLQMTSSFLLVEGEHDRIVINNLIGQDLRRAGVVITPLRGALKVSQIVDSDLLWRFTDARLVLVLDSIDADEMSAVVAMAKELLGRNDRRAAIDALAPLRQDRTEKGKTEREALYGLLRSAVESNRLDRLEVFGLHEPDIIDYFHPAELGQLHDGSEYRNLDRREAWDRLHHTYMQTPKRERKDRGFKSWAVDILGVGTDPTEVLNRATLNLDRVPDDFVRLRDLLCTVSPQAAKRR